MKTLRHSFLQTLLAYLLSLMEVKHLVKVKSTKVPQVRSGKKGWNREKDIKIEVADLLDK
jgi:hypothetical protein